MDVYGTDFHRRRANNDEIARRLKAAKQAARNLKEWKRRATNALKNGETEIAQWIITTQVEGRGVVYRNGHLELT